MSFPALPWATSPIFFFFKQKTAYEITYGDWSSDVCSSDLLAGRAEAPRAAHPDPPWPEDAQDDRAARARSGIPGARARGRQRAAAARARRRMRRGGRGDGAGRPPPRRARRGRRGVGDERQDRAAAQPVQERRLPPGPRRRGPPPLSGRVVRPRVLVRRPRARARRERDGARDRDGAASRRALCVRRSHARAPRAGPDPRLCAGPRLRRPLSRLHGGGAARALRRSGGLSTGEDPGSLEARRVAGLLRADRVRLVLRVVRDGLVVGWSGAASPDTPHQIRGGEAPPPSPRSTPPSARRSGRTRRLP